MTNTSAVESTYAHFLALSGDSVSASLLTLAVSVQGQQKAVSSPLTVAAAAEQLGVSSRTVYDLCEAGKLPHYRAGKGRGTIRVMPDAIAEYKRANGPTADAPRDIKYLRRVAGKR